MGAEPSGSRRGVVFLTATARDSRRILLAARARFPDVAWTVYFRVAQRPALADALDGIVARSDKPSGSKVAFVRGIRSERPALVVIAWTGERDFDRMKLVGLASGARRTVIYDHALQTFDFGARDGRWLRHATCRIAMGATFAPALLAFLRWIYKWSAGLVIGAILLAMRAARRGWTGALLPDPRLDKARAGAKNPRC